jgi:hypothetical protein
MRYLAAALALIAVGSTASADCPNHTAHTVREMFSLSRVVIFAHVTESTFPASVTRENFGAAFEGTATLTVLKSWKGPFSAGSVVKAGPPNFPTSGPWSPRPVHVGDDILIFTLVPEPIWLNTCWVIDRADADFDLAILKTLVSEAR